MSNDSDPRSAGSGGNPQRLGERAIEPPTYVEPPSPPDPVEDSGIGNAKRD